MELTHLNEILSKNKIEFEIIYHEVAIKSRKDAEGLFQLEKTAPTLVLKTDLDFHALVISGARERIDFKMLKRLLGCKKVEMASTEELNSEFGTIAGEVPLIGHNLPCLFDILLLKHEYIYGGTGCGNYTLKINPADVMKVNKTVARIETPE